MNCIERGYVEEGCVEKGCIGRGCVESGGVLRGVYGESVLREGVTPAVPVLPDWFPRVDWVGEFKPPPLLSP